MASCVRLLILAGSIGCAAAAVHAQAPEAPAPAAPAASNGLAELIKNLDAPEAQVRIDATEAIFQSPAITLKQMEAALRAEQLSPEQRQRLLRVAARRFRAEPRAAMGIQNDGNLGSHGVSLAFLQPGFPAAKVLRLGDRIIAAAGVTIDTWETMRAVIISRDPGDEVPITVVREGATLTLTVGLGDFTRLRQPSALDPGILSEAWHLRSRGLDDPDPSRTKPIESGLPANAWTSQYNLLPDEAADLGVASGRPGAEPGIALVPGGEPRGGLEGVVQPPMVQRGGFNLRGLPNRIPGQPLILPQDPAALAAQQQLLVLRSLQQDRMAQMEAITQQLADPTLDAQGRQTLRARLDAVAQQVTKINDELRRLDAQLNPRPFR